MKRKLRFKYRLFFILCISSHWWCMGSVYAQINTLKFDHYTTGDGLSQANVKCIEQGHLGFMWLGTVNGLNRFDGLNFSSFYHNPNDSTSLSSSHITALLEDRAGNLWVGTTNGLNRLDRTTNTFQRFNTSGSQKSIPHDYIYDLLETEDGHIWIATKGGLSQFNTSEQSFTIYQNDQQQSNGMRSNNVRCLYEDNSGTLWIGYYGLDGLQKFIPTTGQFQTVLYEKDEFATTPLNVTIQTMYEDQTGNFWLGTDEAGLLLFHRDSGSYQTVSLPISNFDPATLTINAIQEDNAGNLLVATEGQGLIIRQTAPSNQWIHYQVEPLNKFSINDNFLNSIYKSRDGLIWLGTKDSGVNVINEGNQKFTHFQSNQIAGNNLSHKNVFAISQDHLDQLWVGTANGLNRINDSRSQIDYFFPAPLQKKVGDNSRIAGNAIHAIVQDKAFDIWFGTNNGLSRLEFGANQSQFINYTHSEQDEFSIADNQVWALLEDSKGRFWVGTNQGLNLMNRKTGRFSSFVNSSSKAMNRIRCMLEKENDQLWLGTEDGLVLFDIQSKNFTNITHQSDNPASLSNNFVHCLYLDSRDTLWVGTSEGLNKLIRFQNGTFEFEIYNVIDGLPDNSIYSIQSDRSGNLWLGTNTGLTRFNPRNETIKSFSSQDGLQSGEYNSNASYKNWQGELFFGGSDGLNFFNPQTLPFNEQPPTVVLTDFVINYESVPVQKGGQLEKHISVAEQVTLFPGDNDAFSFEFAALNFTQPHKNTYAYKLENYDDTWKYPKNQNIAFYTNIDPGTYTFRVKAANNDGVWNEQGTSIKVVIQPTLFQTWYFKLGVVLVLIGLGYLIYWSRVRALSQRSETLEKLVRERTEKIEQQNQQLASTVQTLKNTQQQLVVSEKMASLGQLTAGVAHEINNPINFISSNVQALKLDFQDIQQILKKINDLAAQPTSPAQSIEELIILQKKLDLDTVESEIENLLAGIERGTERTVDIVSSLRTFSRNSGDNFAEADLHEGIESTLTILNSQFNGHISIKKEYDPELPLIRCQISRLNQVFLNLINNAIQAIQAKGEHFPGIIHIKTLRRHQFVYLSFTDNGIGMDENTRKRIFEPFYTTKDVGEGTGLGLSISYGIIEQHLGRMEVSSQPSKGSTFTIILPLEPPVNP